MKKRILVVILSLVLTFLIPAQVLVAKTDAVKPLKSVEVTKDSNAGKSMDHRQDTDVKKSSQDESSDVILEGSSKKTENTEATIRNLEKIKNQFTYMGKKGIEDIHYLSLGDSIAYGLSAEPDESYFFHYSENFPDGNSINLAVSGTTTGALLYSLSTPEYQDAVRNANVITISIGGNNLLGPVIGYLYNEYKVDSIEGLKNAVMLRESLEPGSTSGVLYNLILSANTLSSPGELPTLGDALESGKNDYIRDIKKIRQTFFKLNPHAQLLFLNLYNPFSYKAAKLFDDNDPAALKEYQLVTTNNIMYALMERYLSEMNNELSTISQMNHQKTKVINVHDAFYLPNEYGDPVDFDLTTLNFDIHPNTIGHGIIFDLLNEIDLKLSPPYKYGLTYKKAK